MNRLAALFFCSLSIASAHVISMSTGDAVFRDNRIEYILRIPQSELRQGIDPASAIFEHVKFRSGADEAKRIDSECHLDGSNGQLLCAADYSFSRPPTSAVDVECTLTEVTSPNHVHMLRAERGGKFDQAILDATFTSSSLTFRPPTPFEIAAAQISAGAFRTLSSAAQVLLLCALAFSMRRRRELLLVPGAFFLGECVSAIAFLRAGWQASPRFSEAAVALALAYLAVELLAWPEAGGRWILAMFFGTFSGMYFSAFVRESGFQPAYVLSGSVAAGAVVIALCSLVKWRLQAQLLIGQRWVSAAGRTASAAMLAGSAIWFVARLRA